MNKDGIALSVEVKVDGEYKFLESEIAATKLELNFQAVEICSC